MAIEPILVSKRLLGPPQQPGGGEGDRDTFDHDRFRQQAGFRIIDAARRFHPDTREWWVIMDGQIRFDIEGQDSFIATKGSMVQVPMQTIYSMEAIGDKPDVSAALGKCVPGEQRIIERHLVPVIRPDEPVVLRKFPAKRK